MLLLGIDVGTSSIKVTVLDPQSRQCLATASFPEAETAIDSPQNGWAEQHPEMWWEHVQQAILKANSSGKYHPKDIGAIGIAYQMHGLVMVGKNQQVLRPSIIWCDSRAVEIGDAAFDAIGHEKSLQHLLNSPGNFTASKLCWVKQHEPHIYEQADKVMLPGDYIAMKLTGEITTSIPALSEGVFWDFKTDSLSGDVMGYYGFDEGIIPTINPLFSSHGFLKKEIAGRLSLYPGIPVSYKAGDQPNNALSLNVMEPGEVAATAGTSGVIYGISNQLTFDPQSRINSFAHVNYQPNDKHIGVLLCINGTGILNRWVRENIAPPLSYQQINEAAQSIAIGSNGLLVLPFGNGAERMLNNKTIGAQFHNLDFNKHTKAHIFRAAQEGIACSFRYGLDIMRENGMHPQLIKAGYANMFLSEVFTQAFVNATGVPVELYNNDGSLGAAIGAGIGAGIYSSAKDAFAQSSPLQTIEPASTNEYEELYPTWNGLLAKQIQ